MRRLWGQVVEVSRLRERKYKDSNTRASLVYSGCRKKARVFGAHGGMRLGRWAGVAVVRW